MTNQLKLTVAFAILLVLCSGSELGSNGTESLDAKNSTSRSSFYPDINETLAAVSLGVMILLLLMGFFLGNIKDKGDQKDVCRDYCSIGNTCFSGVFRDSAAYFIRGRVSMRAVAENIGKGQYSEKSAATDPNRLARGSPKAAIAMMQQALDSYYEEYGNMDVPEGWIVPSRAPWREQIWGLELGKMVWALGLSLSAPSPMQRSSSVKSNLSVEPSSDTEPEVVSVSEGGEEGHGHRSETWYELFYDLVFVASALQLGLIIKYDHRPLGMAKAAILFYMLRSTWDHVTSYQNRFHKSDLTHMAYYILQSMGACIIALHLRIEEEAVHYENEFSWDRALHQRPIALMAGTVRLLTTFMYVYSPFLLCYPPYSHDVVRMFHLIRYPIMLL